MYDFNRARRIPLVSALQGSSPAFPLVPIQPSAELVLTLVNTGARRALDLGADGDFSTHHAASVQEAVRLVRERPVRALLISPDAFAGDDLARVGQLVSSCRGARAVVIVDHFTSETGERLLGLGAQGVRVAVQLNAKEGWRKLRHLLAHHGNETTARLLTGVMPMLVDATRSTQEFFDLLIRTAPVTTTAREFARNLSIHPSTLSARFDRAQLPSLRRYLGAMRLVYLAAYFERPRSTIATVATSLNFSSPQSLSRHVSIMWGMSLGEFRRSWTFQLAFDHFVQWHVAGYRSQYQSFDPLRAALL